ncbi:NACHT domain-containing protein [Streptomyces erythrochromogenes]|uniref:NACHT domain-containing protein n=1 Tax=Streptomyces erythrochromogenes TaxID=285574 RepID=UPI00368FD886
MRGRWSQQIKGVTADSVVQTQIHITGGNVTCEVDRAARELHRIVSSRLRDEIARLRLEHPGRIPVRWSPTGRPVRSPDGSLGVEGMALTGVVDEVPQFLRSLPRRQLVVLGDPGAGKSVLALLLARDLCRTRRPDDPVPVLLSLSSWRPALGLRAWMARRIRELGVGEGHRRGAASVAALIDENRVMPVLDGLDELPPALHARAVEAIDAAVSEGLPLLVTCRGDAYERTVRESGRYLTRAAVVELAPVRLPDAIAYLEESKAIGDHRWDGVFDALRERPGSALADALSSPLMLYLARTAYQAGPTDPAELLGERFATREEIEAHLLEQYLPAVYAESPSASARRYGADRAGRYLRTVARQMRRDETFDFAWWQVHSPVTGLVVAAAFAGTYGWFVLLLFGTRTGLLSALVTGTVGGVVHLVVRQGLAQVYVTEDVLRGPRAVLRQYAVIGLLSALAVALATGAAVGGWLSRELGARPGAVLGFSALVGGAAGVATLLGSAWGSYQVSRVWFCLTRRLPWRFWAFLDDAHERGVLRQTGAVHEFRHLRVQELLGGRGDPSARSAYSHRTAASARKILLPVLPNAAQAVVALLWLGATGYIHATEGPVELLRFRSGDRPVLVAEPCEGACSSGRVWEWELAPGESRHTLLYVSEPDGPAFTRWHGLMRATGCGGAAVETTLHVGGRPPVSWTVPSNVGKWVDLSAKELAPDPVRLKDEPITITLRRTDGKRCEVSFTWEDAGLHRDGMELARDRFGIPSRVDP